MSHHSSGLASLGVVERAQDGLHPGRAGGGEFDPGQTTDEEAEHHQVESEASEEREGEDTADIESQPDPGGAEKVNTELRDTN